MKERPKYRSFFVTWDSYRQAGHMTQGEMEKKILEDEVDNISLNGKLDQFEIILYKTKLTMEADGNVVGNKVLAQRVSELLGDDISRAQVADARNQIRKKLDYKAGW